MKRFTSGVIWGSQVCHVLKLTKKLVVSLVGVRLSNCLMTPMTTPYQRISYYNWVSFEERSLKIYQCHQFCFYTFWMKKKKKKIDFNNMVLYGQAITK